MSKYTTEVRFICESLYQNESAGYNKIEEILHSVWNKIFDFEFPLYDPAYKEILCKKILKHYYTREIGEETVGLWKLRLNTRMNEIMPYFNDMYRSTTYDFNPFYNVDMTTTHEGSGSGSNSRARTTKNTDTGAQTSIENGTSIGSGTSSSGNAFSNTPQGTLANVDSLAYLTDYRKINEENSSRNEDEKSGTVTVNNERNGEDSESGQYSDIDSYVNHVVGKASGESYAKMLVEYRKSLINIDAMIIEELGDLFMNLW